MSNHQTFVIVGASTAGGKAAATLRDEGFKGRIILLGSDPQRPYERPPLSKDFLRGESKADKAFLQTAEYYQEHNIDLRTEVTASDVDARAQTVTLDTGETISYDKLLLTPGATVRRLDIPGADLDEVYYLRTMKDSERLRTRIKQDGRLAVLGAGWIGMEVAASAQQMGAEVTVIQRTQLPYVKLLGREVGQMYRTVHERHGVKFRTGVSAQSLAGDGRVEHIKLDDGSEVAVDFVVVGHGVRPQTTLAEKAGLQIDNGIVVNEFMETSDPHIYAAGDVANSYRPVFDRHLRIEHIANAERQGPVAAKSMLGQRVPDDRPPYFFSDQYDVGIEYVGYATDWDEVVVRGDVNKPECIFFWVADGVVLAGMNVNIWEVTKQIEALVRAKRPVDLVKLADPKVPLEELAATEVR